MQLPVGEAIVLGIARGITEIFPISSDGHLALAELLFGSRADASTAVALRIGTLGAAVLILRKRAWAALREGLRGLAHPALLRETPGGRDALMVLLSTLPTALIGLAMRKLVEDWSSSPTIVGVCLALSALAAGSTRWAPKGREPGLNALGAVLVGIAQGTAVLPGLSRTAVTIASLLWLGVRAQRAFELSFLMALPAAAGAILLLLGEHHGLRGDALPLLGGALASFAAGAVALLALRRVTNGGKVHYFALYLMPLAAASIAWGYARP